MVTPLSSSSQIHLNCAPVPAGPRWDDKPSSQLDKDQADKENAGTMADDHTAMEEDALDIPSSPFVSHTEVAAPPPTTTPSSPPRSHSPHEAPGSPTNHNTHILSSLQIKQAPDPAAAQDRSPVKSVRSPRKMSSPEKRFPVRVAVASSSSSSLSPRKVSAPAAAPAAVVEKTLDLDDPAVKENLGLQKALRLMEDLDGDTSLMAGDVDDTFATTRARDDDDDYDVDGAATPRNAAHHLNTTSMDDTMISTFSTFSAVPDMTMFAKLGQQRSPSKQLGVTPRRAPPSHTPRGRSVDGRSTSPNARSARQTSAREDGTTNLILDFTDQIHGFSGRQSPAKQARQSPYKHLQPEQGTPFNRNHMSNLLDFDIPPAPTPRSLPSITPRELESLKSSFMSEISSLKASLSGKEAEVNSLKSAVGDAEKRVGESLEQVREERGLRGQLAAEKEEWEKRGREMEAVLRNVKEEIVNGEREREELEGRLEETERRREAAEVMAQAAESKMAAMRAGKNPGSPPPPDLGSDGAARAVELAVEKVSRELHTLYKEKHETKVSALKKSYERRWEKKIKDLEGSIETLTKENEDLRRDNTLTRVDPRLAEEVHRVREEQIVKDAKARELEAELEGLSEVVRSVKEDNSELRALLDSERVEKSRLVQTVEEMLPLITSYDELIESMNAATATPATTASRGSGIATSSHSSTGHNPLASPISQQHGGLAPPRAGAGLSRTSGLRAPGGMSSSGIAQPSESRIGRVAPAPTSMAGTPSKSRDGSARKPRPASMIAPRSGIMSSIERMGSSYRARGE